MNYDVWNLRFAQVPHIIIHLCAAKPREDLGEKAKPLNIRYTLKGSGSTEDEDKSKQDSHKGCPVYLLLSSCELDLAVLAFNGSRFTARS